jgi:hypothetical protein
MEWFDKIRAGSPACAWVGLGHLGALLVALLAMAFDDRQVLGINLWIKPAKFLLSGLIYLWTVGWLLTLVQASEASRHWVGWGMSLILIGENLAISGQALRGERSHFNFSSAANAAVFSLMGAMIAINTILLVVLLWWFLTKAVPMPAAAAWGCRLGVLLAVLASLEGGYMAAYRSHAVGVPDGGPGVPFLNWSTEAGDLRIAHFIGLHGLQVLPAAGFLLPEAGALAGVWIVAALQYGAFVLTWLQAMAKKPLLF